MISSAPADLTRSLLLRARRRDHSRHREGGRIPQRDARGRWRKNRGRRDRVVGRGSGRGDRQEPDDAVTDADTRHTLADCVDCAGDVDAGRVGSATGNGPCK